jgi:AraC family transcriptional regulator, regulatory protein of adaptative response / methylated-DNA-[protein]-cysteine methyltransferase
VSQTAANNLEPALDQAAAWNAILTKDRNKDGHLFYAVVTTGVYCRPSCAARTPRRENVRFFQTAADAEAAGFRPCLRCHPSWKNAGPNADRIRRLCDYIRRHSANGEPLTLAHLSQQTGLSPFHLQRTFKSIVGITPKQYVERCRIDALKTQLRESDSVTAAVYEAGFASSSRVYERSDAHLGMTPRQYRAGGRGVQISHIAIDTPLGHMMLGATDRGLCFLQFGDSPRTLLETLRAEFPAATLEPAALPHSPQFQLWIDSLLQYLTGRAASLDLPLDLRATSFQMKVWTYLQSIPAGTTESYSHIAAATGNPRATRAVARACASNPVALVIPCHRVIRGDGDLGGYRWGLERKRALLEAENRSAAR